MQITDIKTTALRLPEVKPIGDGIQDVLVVEVDTDEGITGIGEVHSSPYIAEAIIHAPMSHYAARGLRQILIGRDPLDRETLWSDMYRMTSVFGRRGVTIHAMSGIDIALWDIAGKASGLSVHKLLGGSYRDQVRAYASVLMPESPEEAKEEVRRCIELGFAGIKLGWGPLANSVKQVVALAEAVRAEAGDDVDIMLDVGFGVNTVQAERLAKSIEALDIYFLEEPLSPDNLVGYGYLSARTCVPIAAGEKETTYWGFRDLIDIGGVQIAQPDLARAGGFTECVRIRDLANRSGVHCIPHCWSSDILLGATLQFAATIPDLPYVEFCTLDTPLRTSLCADPIRPRDGVLEIPDAPGIGIELNRETMERYRYVGEV